MGFVVVLSLAGGWALFLPGPVLTRPYITHVCTTATYGNRTWGKEPKTRRETAQCDRLQDTESEIEAQEHNGNAGATRRLCGFFVCERGLTAGAEGQGQWVCLGFTPYLLTRNGQ